MTLPIADEDIGGARVRMTFTRGNLRMKAGDRLSSAEVRAIPRANRTALMSGGFIEVYPVHTEIVRKEAAVKQDRFIVQVKKDQFNVIEGHRLNEQPLSRSEAEALAGTK